MNKRQKNIKKRTQKKRKTRRTFKRSDILPKREELMRGGNGSVSFPPSISNNIIAYSPQSYLPHNHFSNDPGYSVIAARNTGPFLTGISMGGKRNKRGSSKRGRNVKKVGGGNDITSSISNGLNTITNSTGIIPAPALNEASGVAGIMSGFSGTASAYNPNPVNIAPLA